MKNILEFIVVGSLLFAACCCIVLVYIAPVFFLIKMIVIPLMIAFIAYIGSKVSK